LATKIKYFYGSAEETLSEHFILCFVEEGARPVRDPASDVGKWFLAASEYPRDTFPPHCSGAAYVTTVASMRRILEAAK
jgi:hypothetical protein